MRIGIDMRAVQTGSRHRGIGRYSHNLVAGLLAADRAVEYVLYHQEGLPDDLIPAAPNARRRPLRHDPARGEVNLWPVMERVARSNPDDLDVLLWLDLMNPFEFPPGAGPPARPLGGPAMAAVVYDMIPCRFPDRYLTDPELGRRYYQRLENLRRYDALLAISESARADTLELLGLPPERVVSIAGASDGRFFTPAPGPLTDAERDALAALGIDGPFVFNLGGIDERKNMHGLIDAFALLPERLRSSHTLVLSCILPESEAAHYRWYAAHRGVPDRVVLTGPVTDEALRLLYRRCVAFAFPSQYEGFGLPILEALHCGAAVLAGHNSSQPEVLGGAGLLANAADPGDIAEKLHRLLADAPLRAGLKARAAAQASRFSWARSAGLALAHLKAAAGRRDCPSATRALAARPGRRLRADRGAGSRPRLAFFSPFPPKTSGISDYSVRLLDRLDRDYQIDIYHDSGYVPNVGLDSPRFACHDYRLFERNRAVLGYDGIVYQMGNYAGHHGYVYDLMMRHPGLVTLHDYCLWGFFYSGHRRDPGQWARYYRDEVATHPPARAAEFPADLPGLLDAWEAEEGGGVAACSRRGLYLNRRLFARSRGVIVHSPWCIDRVRAEHPEFLDKVHLILYGARLAPADAATRSEVRARFQLPQDALILGSFGFLGSSKMNVETVEAFAPLAAELPRAMLVFVGPDWGGGEARRKVQELGLADRVRFLGPHPADVFAEIASCVDVGVNLRRPPTYGETSAALIDLLRVGVPTIVTDVGTFSDFPDTAVRKIRWDADGPASLAGALRTLATSEGARRDLGAAALQYVRENHSWDRAASRYGEVLDRLFGPNSTPAPHARGAVAPDLLGRVRTS